MKKNFYLIVVSLLAIASWHCHFSSTSGENPSHLNNGGINAKNEVVLELFTSQGCSSCPPADKFLGNYINNDHVIPLSFHVDYWDRLGWKDPFSSHDFSERQFKYAAALHSDYYTPQLVINGTQQFIGGEAGKITNAINQLLPTSAGTSLSITNAQIKDSTLLISVDLKGNVQHANLDIALVQKKAVTPVGDGENRGATLTDFNVVRYFQTMDTIKPGENNLVVNIPASLKPGNRQIILYTQEKAGNRITGAVKRDF
ncbi:MAG TPA: DUF1223 domain-containing protein [Hanamia sp.]|nr:DUF1223 domain-containing protein [Hanamia sp.]